MENKINVTKGILKPLSMKTANSIAQWEYEAPYEGYSFKGHQDEYLLDESMWGVEQFCLACDGILLGQVACQHEGNEVGQWHRSLRIKETVLPLQSAVFRKSAEKMPHGKDTASCLCP